MSKKCGILTGFMITIFIILFVSITICANNEYMELYNTGVSLLEMGEYDEALECFSSIPNYMDYRDIQQLLNKYGISMCPHCGALLN